MKETFSSFKNDFYSRIKDFSIFDVNDINILKVVLDGLKVNYVSKGKVNSFMFYPYPIYKTYCFFKSLEKQTFKSKLNVNTTNRVIIIDNNRRVKESDNSKKSLYFDNIVKLLDKSSLQIIQYPSTTKKVYNDEESYSFFENIFLFEKLTNEEKKFRQSLIETFVRIKKSKLFTESELKNIKFSIHRFFHEYKVWNRILDLYPNINKSLLVCHYHKEGIIYSMKRKNIFTIELQHGLIAQQDIFYCFPDSTKQIIDKALFANQIWVYGEYWKNVLMKGAEYSENKIFNIGYYLYEKMFSKEDNFKLENIIVTDTILITTQTHLHEEFIDFAKKLYNFKIASNKNFSIVIKPHPAENKEIYLSAFKDFSQIYVVDIPINILFKHIKVHISIYSTTLYDALRFGVKNYVFSIPRCKDYVLEIVNNGVAELIEDDLGNFYSNSVSNKIDSSYYFEDFNKNLLLNTLH